MTIRTSIVGGSGYTGGELLRLLLAHPETEIAQVSSRSLVGQPITRMHPNLRGHLAHNFVTPDEIEPCDVVFLCMPHGQASKQIDRWREAAPLVVDLSADFRIKDPDAYQRWYGEPHPNVNALDGAVYGLAELSRSQLSGARLISGVGCNATAMNLALLPLARAGLIKRVVADIKVGSSEAGAEASAGSHHPVRARTARTYSPFGHRHLAEVEQAFGEIDIDATVTAIDMVRGVLCTAHVEPTRPVEQKELWKLYRGAFGDEPFVRIVAERSGPNRFPDPRVLVGSNHADVGFAVDERSGRIVAISAIDNLVKGAAGSAIQAMNVALGLGRNSGPHIPRSAPRVISALTQEERVTMSTIVIKIGGGEGIEPTALCPEIASLVREGHRVVVVHGGSHETNVLAEALGHPTQTITSPGGRQSRRTDRRTLEIFEMIYCGKVNKAMVESLRREGVDAIGLSGIDAGLWIGSRKEAIRAVEDGRTFIIRDDLSGRVERVDAAFLNLLMDAGRVVVLTPPAVTEDGIAINVDADRAAAATAGALGAEELLLLSNVPGLLRDPADQDSLIESVEREDLDVARSAAKGRMKNKVLAAEEALSGGVTRVVIGSAGGEGAIARARAGQGTVFACGAVAS